jgi:hypothetical protein
MTVLSCLDIVIKLGIFEKMKTRDQMTAQDLSNLVDVDSGIIGWLYLLDYGHKYTQLSRSWDSPSHENSSRFTNCQFRW